MPPIPPQINTKLEKILLIFFILAIAYLIKNGII